MTKQIQTWHKGLVARWWSEFNHDGPEIDFYRSIIEHSGEPALDLGCGTGRLLLPWISTGMDVAGVDVASDMLDHCRENANEQDLSPTLYCQAMHELAIAQKFQTIILCGAFGIGGTRDQDLQTLERCYEHLLPGGTIALDHELPSATGGWRFWQNRHKPDLPMDWGDNEDRRMAEDGSELALKSRLLEFDPLQQTARREIKVEHWKNGILQESETYPIRLNVYFRNELIALLQKSGFEQVEVKGDFTHEIAQPYVHSTLVYVARKPAN